MIENRSSRRTLLLAAMTAAATANAQPARTTADLGGTTLPVYTWRPEACAPTGILIVFHGLGRNVPGYRDYAIPIARRTCMLVVAPEFSETAFPTWSYQRGGVVRQAKVRPQPEWTVNLVPRIVDWARMQQARPDLPYALIGHSAGAQFLSRAAAYVPLAARPVVIANPSTWVRASAAIAAPYGFGGIPDGEAALRRYLAAPVTVLLGEQDTGSQDLADDAEARAQGPTRLARGQNAFAEAKAEATKRGWPFNWTLSIVPATGHSAAKMLASDQAMAAFLP